MTKKYTIISIVTVLIILIGVSFAYYRVQIIGTGSNMVLETKYMRIVFTDTTEIVDREIIPGWSTSKTFTVENKFEDDTSYDILLENYINTFVTVGNLQFKIVSEDGGYNTVSDDENYIDMAKSQSARTIALANDIALPTNAKHNYTIYLRYKDSEESQTADMLKTLSGRLGVREGTEDKGLQLANLPSDSLKYHILKDNNYYKEEWIEERASFSDIYTDSYKTFFRTNNAENGDTVFYYAGNATNNWVIFGKCASTKTSGTVAQGYYNCTAGYDLYWRIIRTNEESTGGGIRLLYAGSGLQENYGSNNTIVPVQNAYIGTSNWYSSHNAPNYVGYTRKTNDYTEGVTTLSDIRGNEIDSNIKTAVDNWYLGTFSGTDYEDYIDTKAIYCNDRSTIADKTGGLTINTYFGAYGRLASSKAPSYACGVNNKGFGNNYFEGNTKEDKYTAEDENAQNKIGNGYLTKVINEETVKTPAALMTADEAAFAGGKHDTKLISPYAWYYLNANEEGTAAQRSATAGQYWWTMSPSGFHSSSRAYAWLVYGSTDPGNLGGYVSVTFSYAVRPAISLKSDTLWASGNGTPENPYVVSAN